jgi:hypothetical protein
MPPGISRQIEVGARAILAHQHDAVVGGQRDHVDPVDGLDDREALRLAGRRMGRIDEVGREDLVVAAGVAVATRPAQVVVGIHGYCLPEISSAEPRP